MFLHNYFESTFVLYSILINYYLKVVSVIKSLQQQVLLCLKSVIYNLLKKERFNLSFNHQKEELN